MKAFLAEEARESFSDLSARRASNGAERTRRPPIQPIDVTPIRNHGLLSKAERALDIAGWSPASKRDLEVFKLVDVDGLTPLLSLLNDATLDAPTAQTPASARPSPTAVAPM